MNLEEEAGSWRVAVAGILDLAADVHRDGRDAPDLVRDQRVGPRG